MKSNNVFLVFFLLQFSVFSFAQGLGKIEYTHTQQLNERDLPFEKPAVLYYSDSASIFYYQNESGKKNTQNEDGSLNIFIAGDSNDSRFVYQDYTKGELYNNSYILSKLILSRDSLNLFNWEIYPNDTITINGYKCKTAKTNFRGRDYVARYTEEIPIASGPWKFNGLPGLILKVEDVENKIKFEAKSSFGRLNENDLEFYSKFSFDRAESINWEEYKKLFIKKYSAYFKDGSSRYGNDPNITVVSSNFNIPMKIEIFDVE